MRSFWTIGMGFVAGSAMTLLGSVGTAATPPPPADADTVAAAAHEARAAQFQADEARDRAAQLSAQGGWAYKSGAVDRAEAEAARYQAQADDARGVASGTNWATYAVSPAMSDAQDNLANLKAQGGWAYKSGAVARAEADIEALGAPTSVATSASEEQAPPANWGKPVEQTQREPGTGPNQ
jgi:hypothetical protein